MASDRTSVLRDPSPAAGATISYTGTAGVTAAFKRGPTSVMVWASTACYVVVGEGVTATTADTPIPGSVPFWFPVPDGSGAPWRVSAIQITTGGDIYAKPFT